MTQKSNPTTEILSIIGGVLTVTFFLGSLVLSSILRSETSCLIIGNILIITTLFISRLLTKPFLDAMDIMRYIAGRTLTDYGMNRNMNVLFIVLVGISVVTMLLSKGFILTFLSVISFYMALFGEITNLFSSLNPPSAAAVPIMATLLFVNLSETKISSYANGDFSKYKPIHFSLFVSCVFSLVGLSVNYLTESTNGQAISVFMLAGILLIVYRIVQVVQVKSPVYQVCIYLLYAPICLSSLHVPYLSGSILLILIHFHYGYKTESAITPLPFVYSIFKYYYDLDTALLTKSIALFFTGIVSLITWYIFTQEKTRHEKI